MQRRLHRVLTLLLVAPLAILPTTSAVAAPTQPSADQDAATPPPPRTASVVPSAERATVLGNGWKRSIDRAWLTSGDADGFHVLVADARTGYDWRTAATLSEPGMEADQWIGNACVTGSGRRLVVSYAPRTFTNDEILFARGAYTAIVDLVTGQVRKLKIRSTLAYYSPGCGADESAVITQEGDEHLAKTRVSLLHADTGATDRAVVVPGQLTSAVPVRGQILAADKQSVVRVGADGVRTLVAPAIGVPYHLSEDADGALVFMDHNADDANVRRMTNPLKHGAGNRIITLAHGRTSQLGIARGAAGKLFLLGDAKTEHRLPSTISSPGVGKNAVVSSRGELAITNIQLADGPDPRATVADPLAPRSVRLDAKVMRTGKAVVFTVDPGHAIAPKASSGRVGSPGTSQTSKPVSPRAATSPTNPVDEDRYCSVPRNDPYNQALQPKPRQVEWAVDQAVRGSLTVQRESNWKGLGMPAYTPQGLFPRIGLVDGPNTYVPAQIMLGIATQESNLWQASRSALPGVTGDPLVGNFYGRPIYDDSDGNDWDIHWEDSDCGYGVTQVTDGMRLAGHEKNGETALPYQTQRAVALDFAANIAAGLQILERKWNQVKQAGMIINNGDPAYIENWFYAVWAYNSGFHPDQHDGQPWGVGWANNPINPHFLPGRDPFLEYTYDNARFPQYWPYPEKVIGWAGHPINSVESPNHMVAGYRQAWWNDSVFRVHAKPPENLFCNVNNQCEPGAQYVPTYPGNPPGGDGDVRGEPAGPCGHQTDGMYDLKCWYHVSADWKDCYNECGHELLRFDPGYAYQEDGTSYPPDCTTVGLPSNAMIIDDVSAPSVRPNCTQSWTTHGSLSFTFAADGQGRYPSKVDFHQIGAGFGGHFWFDHTYGTGPEGDKMRVTGTWTLNQSLNSWARVLVHLPDHGAQTQQAEYGIALGNGTVKSRYLNQNRQANNWVSIGVYPFDGVPKVTLSNYAADGRGDVDVAWDAVAFQPLVGKPRHIVAVLGDSYTSGEGAGDYYTESDTNHGTPEWNACRRSKNSWPRRMTLPGTTMQAGTLSDGFSSDVELTSVACSGARNWHVQGDLVPASWSDPSHYEKGDGEFHEIGQLNSGVVNEDTTLVVLTIGGNDENVFVDLVVQCALGCPADLYLQQNKNKIDEIQSSTKETIRRIAAKAPNAQIVLESYPRMMSPGSGDCGPFAPDSLDTMAAVTDYGATSEVDAVAELHDTEGINVATSDRPVSFQTHGGCDIDPWINTIVGGPHGEGDSHAGDAPVPFCFWGVIGDACLSRESFHPNSGGTSGLAWNMDATLTRIGYTGG